MQFKACQYRCDPDGLPIKTDGWLNGGAEYSPCFGGGSVLTWSVAQPSERRSTTATATNAAIALIVFIFHSLSQPVKPLVECLSLECAPTFLQINLRFLPGNKNGTAKKSSTGRALCQPSIPTNEQSGSLTHIAMMESVSLC